MSAVADYLAAVRANLAQGEATEHTHRLALQALLESIGYPACKKWLKDRKGRVLTSDDLPHYQNIGVALSETIRRMREIDRGIPGWPFA